MKGEQLLSEIHHSQNRTAENLYFSELLHPLEKYDPDNFRILKEKLLASQHPRFINFQELQLVSKITKFICL